MKSHFKTFTLIVLSLILISAPLTAQEHKYERAGVSVIYTTYSDGFDNSISDYYKSFIPDSRYDVNKILTTSMPASWKRINYKVNDSGTKVYSTTTNTEAVTAYLKAKNIGKQVISSIFNRKQDGTMDLMTVHYRGQYNATDQEYLTSVSSKRGAEALKETGEMLINQSYIVVLDMQNVRYEKLESDTDHNYRGQMMGYIYKIEWSENLLYAIWDCWIDENTPESEKNAKIEAYNNLQELKEKWEKRKVSLENWENNWDNIQPFFKYGPQTRKIMYTTNAIESLNNCYKRLNKGRRVLPTIQALEKSMYLSTKIITEK